MPDGTVPAAGVDPGDGRLPLAEFASQRRVLSEVTVLAGHPLGVVGQRSVQAVQLAGQPDH